MVLEIYVEVHVILDGTYSLLLVVSIVIVYRNIQYISMWI